MQLAELVKASAAELDFDVSIDDHDNPRVELEEHYYNAVHDNLLELGLEPALLGDELVRSVLKTIEQNKDRVIESAIEPNATWKSGSISSTPA